MIKCYIKGIFKLSELCNRIATRSRIINLKFKKLEKCLITKTRAGEKNIEAVYCLNKKIEDSKFELTPKSIKKRKIFFYYNKLKILNRRNFVEIFT